MYLTLSSAQYDKNFKGFDCKKFSRALLKISKLV